MDPNKLRLAVGATVLIALAQNCSTVVPVVRTYDLDSRGEYREAHLNTGPSRAGGSHYVWIRAGGIGVPCSGGPADGAWVDPAHPTTCRADGSLRTLTFSEVRSMAGWWLLPGFVAGLAWVRRELQ